MSEWLPLAGLVGVCGLFAFMIFGPRNRYTMAVSLLLLVGINVGWVVFTYWIWKGTGSHALGIIMLGGWFILQKHCHDTTAPPRKLRSVIIMERRATPEEAANFNPDRYFRFCRSVGWRRLELEIDDAIEIPDSIPIPVQDLGGGVFQNKGGVYLHVGGWIAVFFEYKDEVFYGNMRLRNTGM